MVSKKEKKQKSNQAYAALVFPSNNPDSYLENGNAIVTKFLERGENGQTAARFPITFGGNNPATTDEKQAEAILYARGKSGNNYDPQVYAGKNVTLDIFVESDSYGKPNIRHNNTQDHFYLWSKVLAVLQKMEANNMASLTLRLFNKKGQALDEEGELLSSYLKNCFIQIQDKYPKLDGIIGKIPVYIRETAKNYGVELEAGSYAIAISKPKPKYDTTIVDPENHYQYHKIENGKLTKINTHAEWENRLNQPSVTAFY